MPESASSAADGGPSDEHAATRSDEQTTSKKNKKEKEHFTFTQDGCRTEIRIGALLVLVAIFVWLWQGPTVSGMIYMIGMPFLLVGAPWQAWEGKTQGRSGYPLRLGMVLLVGGLLMWPDLLYRETIDGPKHVQPMGPMLVLAGAWLVIWWPLARMGKNLQVATVEDENKESGA